MNKRSNKKNEQVYDESVRAQEKGGRANKQARAGKRSALVSERGFYV